MGIGTALAGLTMLGASVTLKDTTVFGRMDLHRRRAQKALDFANKRLNSGKCGSATMLKLRVAQASIAALDEDIALLSQGLLDEGLFDDLDKEHVRFNKDTSRAFGRILANHHERFGRCIAGRVARARETT